MKQLTIILLCITVIWSYYKTAINGENSICLMCKEAKTLFCRKKNINSLNSILPQNFSSIERLVADDNNITLSEKDIGILNNITSLKFLDLRKNNIGPDLNDRTRIKHNKLKEIDLDGNKITKIPKKFFSEIPKLEVLKLSNNKISEIPEDLLDNNTEIKALVLSGNEEIEKIPAKLFKKPKNTLEALLVDGTSLKDIPTEILDRLPNLKGLNVRNNNNMAPPQAPPLNPKIFYKHDSLRFLFTSGYADCCNINRMKKMYSSIGKPKNKWYCSFKNSDGWKESCAIRIRSGVVEDTFMGHVEVNVDKSGIWKKIKSDNWTMNDANVVCKEAGHGKALEYIDKTNYRRRTYMNKTIFPDNVEGYKLWKGNCNDSEFSILRCGKMPQILDDTTGNAETRGVGVRCEIPEEEMKIICGKYTDHDVEVIQCSEKGLHNLPWQKKNDTKIKEIYLKDNKIRWIYDTSLKFFKNLTKLDLSENGLAWLGNDVFQIENLLILILKKNYLKYITEEMNTEEAKNANWFGGLAKLLSLDISSNSLKTFPRNVFKPLEKLHNMTMRDNSFYSFDDRFFEHLGSMEFLDISENPGLQILNWEELINDLKSLNYLVTGTFTDCCFVENLKPGTTCEAPADELASCERMIKFPALRYLMWFLVVLTIGGNLFALLMRLVKDDTNKVQNMLICSLSFSDMLMGVYLAGIINQEIATRGEYYKHDYYWRTGSSCKVFGIISVISSEVSVFTLVFIAYDRFLHIVHALEFKKIGYRTAVFLLVVTWFGCAAIAVIPATVDSYFYDELRRKGFYGTSSICMPLQLPGEDSIAWEYCFAVFGALNFIGAMYLIVAYCQIFYSSYTSAKNSKNSARLGIHTTMAKRFAAVVFTDVCCWVPIAMLLLLSLVRVINDSGNELYMWFSICVIPINSAINPILYTLSTPLFWAKVKETMKKMLFCISKGNVANDKPELIAKLDREKKA